MPGAPLSSLTEFAQQRRKKIQSVFRGGVYVAKNTLRSALRLAQKGFALLCEVYLQYFSIYAFWLWMMTFTASSRPRTSLTSVSLPSRLL